ncbi:MAG: toxin TcdB middle/N-terminal domain-containing protein, partial [Wenzhouxiangellaceae bacterium]
MQFNESTGEYQLVSTDVLALTEDDDAGGLFAKARDLRLADLNADGLVDAVYYNPAAARWEQKRGFGLGGFGPIHSINHWPTADGITKHMQLADVNGDGHPDALFPSADSSGSAVWQVSLWDWSRSGGGQGNYSVLTNTAAAAGNVGNGAGSMFADFNGSGKTDQLLIVPNTSNGDLKYLFGAGVKSGGGIFLPTYVLKRITDGFGAWTDLAYRPLTDPAVYRRGSSGAQTSAAGSAIYDVIPSIHVVSSATSLSPQYELNSDATGSTYHANGTTMVQYFYRGARVQGGGRGFLGFREVASYDPQSGMLTRTRYRQDFPFIGLPEATRSWFLSATPWPSNGAPDFPGWVEASCSAFNASTWNSSGKIFLGCSENAWSKRPTTGGLTHPYLARSEEWSFNPSYSSGNLTGSKFTHRVVTENSGIDVYGNVGQVAVSTYTSRHDSDTTGGMVARQATSNEYLPPDISSTKWHLGRLSCSTVSSTRGGQTITRRSTFGYDADTGILNRETVNASSCSDTSGSLKTTYTLDGFGNRQVTTVTGADIGPARKTRSLYDGRGSVKTEQVWLNGDWHTTREVLARDRYGNATRIEDAQGVTATARFDAMGRPHYSYTPDGAWTRVQHRTGGHSYCPSGTASYEKTTASDGSQSWVCKDKLGREMRTVVLGFDGERINTDTRYDYATRPIEVSEPYKTGQSAYYTRTVYDEIGRVEMVRTPDPANGNPDQRWLYTEVAPGIIRTTHTNAKDRPHRTDRNALGEKVKEIATGGGITTYGYDALGQLTSTDGPLSGSSDEVVIQYNDLGHKERLIDPDKGTWDYRHNALGELTCQIDAKGQGTQIVYDELGRRTIRRERTGVSNLASCAGTTVGTTTWTYGATALTPEFGQLIEESSHYNDAEGANHTTTRDYGYDDLGRLELIETTIAEAGNFNRSYIEQTTYDQFGRVFQQFDAAGGDRGTRFRYNARGYL